MSIGSFNFTPFTGGFSNADESANFRQYVDYNQYRFGQQPETSATSSPITLPEYEDARNLASIDYEKIKSLQDKESKISELNDKIKKEKDTNKLSKLTEEKRTLVSELEEQERTLFNLGEFDSAPSEQLRENNIYKTYTNISAIEHLTMQDRYENIENIEEKLKSLQENIDASVMEVNLNNRYGIQTDATTLQKINQLRERFSQLTGRRNKLLSTLKNFVTSASKSKTNANWRDALKATGTDKTGFRSTADESKPDSKDTPDTPIVDDNVIKDIIKQIKSADNQDRNNEIINEKVLNNAEYNEGQKNYILKEIYKAMDESSVNSENYYKGKFAGILVSDIKENTTEKLTENIEILANAAYDYYSKEELLEIMKKRMDTKTQSDNKKFKTSAFAGFIQDKIVEEYNKANADDKSKLKEIIGKMTDFNFMRLSFGNASKSFKATTIEKFVEIDNSASAAEGATCGAGGADDNAAKPNQQKKEDIPKYSKEVQDAIKKVKELEESNNIKLNVDGNDKYIAGSVKIVKGKISKQMEELLNLINGKNNNLKDVDKIRLYEEFFTLALCYNSTNQNGQLQDYIDIVYNTKKTIKGMHESNQLWSKLPKSFEKNSELDVNKMGKAFRAYKELISTQTK